MRKQKQKQTQTLAQKAVERYKDEKCRRVPKSGIIRCRDCLKEGFFSAFDNGDYAISDGWLMVRYRFRTVFICKECQEKRRELAKQLLRTSA